MQGYLLSDQNSWLWKAVNCLKLRITRLPWKPLHVQPHPCERGMKPFDKWWLLFVNSFWWNPFTPSSLVTLGNMSALLQSEFMSPEGYCGFERSQVLCALVLDIMELCDTSYEKCWEASEWLYSQNIMLMVKWFRICALKDSNLDWRGSSLNMAGSLYLENDHVFFWMVYQCFAIWKNWLT